MHFDIKDVAIYVIAIAIIIGMLLASGTIALPLWVMWGIIIASGNLIYVKIRHGSETETLSLTMTMILLAILNLSWPEIALATLLGVGFGQIAFGHGKWYKRLYSITAISTAGVLTEIAYTYWGGIFHTIIGAAAMFDITLYTLLVPIWLFVAKQSLREIHTSYISTIYMIPLSAALALIIYFMASFGVIGITLMSLGLFIFLRPEYTLPVKHRSMV